MRHGGGLVSFVVRGGLSGAQAFLNRLRLISLSSNLGDARSIATHPATTTHSKLSQEEKAAVGIKDGLIRISVGLEHISDLKADLEQALAD
jgi:O-succinylhomoserine sulfhydrylase